MVFNSIFFFLTLLPLFLVHELFRMQRKKQALADSGSVSVRADNWFDKAVKEVSAVASRIMDDSTIDNALLCPSDSSEYTNMKRPQAEKMRSLYGSFNPPMLGGSAPQAELKWHEQIYHDSKMEVRVAMFARDRRNIDSLFAAFYLRLTL